MIHFQSYNCTYLSTCSSQEIMISKLWFHCESPNIKTFLALQMFCIWHCIFFGGGVGWGERWDRIVFSEEKHGTARDKRRTFLKYILQRNPHESFVF